MDLLAFCCEIPFSTGSRDVFFKSFSNDCEIELLLRTKFHFKQSLNKTQPFFSSRFRIVVWSHFANGKESENRSYITSVSDSCGSSWVIVDGECQQSMTRVSPVLPRLEPLSFRFIINILWTFAYTVTTYSLNIRSRTWLCQWKPTLEKSYQG